MNAILGIEPVPGMLLTITQCVAEYPSVEEAIQGNKIRAANPDLCEEWEYVGMKGWPINERTSKVEYRFRFKGPRQ